MLLLLSSIGMVSTVGYLGYKIINTDNNEIITKFDSLMENLKLQNTKEQKVSILKIIEKKYGYDAIIGIPIGISYNKLESYLPEIQDTLCADIIMNKAKSSNSAYMRIGLNLNNKDVSMIEKIRFKWHKIMQGTNIKNHVGDTFKISKIVENDNIGYGLEVIIPEGLTVNKLHELLPTLEDNLNSKIIINSKQTYNSIQMILIPNNTDLKELSFKDQIQLKWMEIMNKCEMSNKQGESFTLKNTTQTSYGFDSEIICPINLGVDNLFKNKQYIENGLNGQVVIINNSNKPTIKVNNITSQKGLSSFIDIMFFRWEKLMEEFNLKSKVSNNTFHMMNLQQTNFGFECDLSIPDSLDIDELVKKQITLENNLRAFVELEWFRFKGNIHMRVANIDIPDNEEFKPIQTKLWELYCGTTYFREDIIVNIKEDAHMSISGSSGSGKSVFAEILATNITYWNNPDKVWFYFAQISDKKDFDGLVKLKHTRYYAETLEDTKRMLKHIMAISKERNRILRKHNKKNIWEFNKKFPNYEMPLIILMVDEFATYMDDNTDNDDLAKLKKEILDMYKKIGNELRNTGVEMIVCTQRPDRDSISPTIKKNLNAKISYRQPNTSSSLTSTDDNRAVGLKQREAWVDFCGKQKFIKTLYFDDRVRDKYLSKSIDENHKYHNLDVIDVIDPNDESTFVYKQDSDGNYISNGFKKKVRTRAGKENIKKTGDLHYDISNKD